MEKLTIFAAAISIGIMTLSLQIIDPGLAPAADQQSKTKPHSTTIKPKTVKPKAVKPKTVKPETVQPKNAQPETAKPKIEPKFQTAETAAEGNACFGVAPQIERLVPDEGEPGVKVTITGAEFGSPDCLRGVSFGPGYASTFTMENESTILATVPTDGRKGLVMVTVTTASGEDSKPFLVK
ncbi:MAG TPA: IPT/TIG domain-containing protein [Nitrospira sp.]|nr:IPT/TIG domain-containing protein [Nitrospira sp.]